jgi:hypothetical protein
MNYNRIKLYWKTCILKGGRRVNLHVTYACNRKCAYCGLKMPHGRTPKAKYSTTDEWKDFLDRFPVRVREIYICGGEPTVYPQFTELINWLLSEGYHIVVYTNLSHPEKLLEIPKNYRFSVLATFHHDDDPERFVSAYEAVYKVHRIDVDEIDYGVLPFSRVKPFMTREDYRVANKCFIFSPDRQIFLGSWDCYEMQSR